MQRKKTTFAKDTWKLLEHGSLSRVRGGSPTAETIDETAFAWPGAGDKSGTEPGKLG